MQALKSKGNEGLEATRVQGSATPVTEHPPAAQRAAAKENCANWQRSWAKGGWEGRGQ